MNETSLEFVGCSFENGTCGWEEVSEGQFAWVRGRNGSESTGPSVDHTLGSELGRTTHFPLLDNLESQMLRCIKSSAHIGNTMWVMVHKSGRNI